MVILKNVHNYVSLGLHLTSQLQITTNSPTTFWSVPNYTPQSFHKSGIAKSQNYDL